MPLIGHVKNTCIFVHLHYVSILIFYAHLFLLLFFKELEFWNAIVSKRKNLFETFNDFFH